MSRFLDGIDASLRGTIVENISMRNGRMTLDESKTVWTAQGFTCITAPCDICNQDSGTPCTDISTPQALAAPIYLSYPHPERMEMLSMLAGDGHEPTITQFDDAVERTGLL